LNIFFFSVGIENIKEESGKEDDEEEWT